MSDAENNTSFDIFLHDRDTAIDGIFDEPGAISTTLVSKHPSGGSGDDARRPSAAMRAGSSTAKSRRNMTRDVNKGVA